MAELTAEIDRVGRRCGIIYRLHPMSERHPRRPQRPIAYLCLIVLVALVAIGTMRQLGLATASKPAANLEMIR